MLLFSPRHSPHKCGSALGLTKRFVFVVKYVNRYGRTDKVTNLPAAFLLFTISNRHRRLQKPPPPKPPPACPPPKTSAEETPASDPHSAAAAADVAAVGFPAATPDRLAATAADERLFDHAPPLGTQHDPLALRPQREPPLAARTARRVNARRPPAARRRIRPRSARSPTRACRPPAERRPARPFRVRCPRARPPRLRRRAPVPRS